MNDIELERQLVEEQSEHVNTNDDGDEAEDLSPAEQHREAQESGEVFEDGYRGDGL